MGLMCIASTLREAGHDVRIHDCVDDPETLDSLDKVLSSFNPGYVGISVIVSEKDAASRVVNTVKRIVPDAVVIFGGPWPSTNYEKSLREMGADFVVVGEGERTTPELIDAIEHGRAPSSVPGTASLNNGELVFTFRPALTSIELDDLPLPAWDLIDKRLYDRRISIAGVGRRPYMSVVTSRGCPFRCAYCHQTMGKHFRSRSAQSVLTELAELKSRYGLDEFEIIDDCFNLDRPRMHSILRGIQELFDDPKIHFPNGVRADLLEPDDIRLMRKAGTRSACFAIETASPRLQKMVHKNLDIDAAILTIRTAVKCGIYSTGLFMLGFPTETYEEAESTVSLATSLPLHRAYFMLVTPFEGTELAVMAKDSLDSVKDRTDLQNLNYLTNSINISAMSDVELRTVFRRSYSKFYLRPLRILRVIWRHPRKRSLFYYGLIALKKMFRRLPALDGKSEAGG